MNKLTDFIKTIEGYIGETKTRTFDLYILGPFLIWYGIKSRGMPKIARRLLVTGGIYQIFYSWNKYRQLQKGALEALQPADVVEKPETPFTAPLTAPPGQTTQSTKNLNLIPVIKESVKKAGLKAGLQPETINPLFEIINI